MNPTKLKLILKLIFIFITLGLMAQDLPSVLPPSPTVANLMSFEEVPVDYHSGQPNISIPLLSKQVDQGLNLNAALRYSTQGVKVDNHSSWVGTGWSLSVGGSISRTIRGLPDDMNVSDRKGVLHIPDFWNHENLNQEQKNEYRWNVIGTSTIRLDSELDLYQFMVNGLSGRFVVVLEAGELKAKIISNVSSVKINLDYDPVTLKINSFELIDTQGLKYTLSQKEVTNTNYFTATMSQLGDPTNFFTGKSPGSYGSGFSFPTDSIGGIFDLSISDNSGFSYNYSHENYSATSAWHLTTIKTYNDQVLVDYYYSPDNVSYEINKSFTRIRIESVFGPSKDDILSNTYNIGILEPRKKVSYHQVGIATAKLDSIRFRDGTSWAFITDPNRTHPETNGKVLSSILEYHADSPVRSFDLEINEAANRLWLDKVKETDLSSNEIRNYDLAYNDRNNLNSYGGFKDIWGYNNAPINPVFDPEIPLPFDYDFIKKGLLSSITFPTGGSQHFEFEHNSFSYAKDGNEIEFDDYIKSPQNFTNRSLIMPLSGSYNLVATSGLIDSEPLDITHDQQVLIKIPALTADPSLIQNMRLVVLDSNGVQENQIGIDVDRGNFLELTKGAKTIRLEALNAGTYTIEGSVRIYYQELHDELQPFYLGGGVRIKSIEFKDGLSLKRKFNYSYNESNEIIEGIPVEVGNTSKSSGAVDAIFGKLRMEYHHTITKSLFSTPINDFINFRPVDIRYFITTQNGLNAGISKGQYVNYKNVKVEEVGNGYSINQYTTAQDFPVPSAAFELPVSAPAPDYEFQRGLLMSQKIYNTDHQLLKKDTILYEYQYDTITRSIQVVNLKTCAYRQFYDSYNNNSVGFPTKNIPTTPMGAHIYPYPYTTHPLPSCEDFYVSEEEHTIGWAQKKEVWSTQYFYDEQQNQSSIFKKQLFDYNTSNYQVSLMEDVTREAGDTVTTMTQNYYPVGLHPNGYTEIAGKAALSNVNRINEIIYSEQTRIEGSNSYPLSKTKNIFHLFPNGTIGLTEVLSAKGDYPLEKRIEIHQYDEYGNPIEVSKSNDLDTDMRTVYLWGYNNTRPVVQILDVSWQDIPEFIRTDIGSADESSLIGIISDLRGTYFPDKQITSYLYDDGLRMKEARDPNGFTSTYLYDGLGRLIQVRDQDGNLIQDLTYKTRN